MIDPCAPVQPWAPGLLPDALSSPEAEAAAAAFAAAAPTRTAAPRKRAGRSGDDGAPAEGEADSKRPRESAQPAQTGVNISEDDPAGDFKRKLATAADIDAKMEVMLQLRKARILPRVWPDHAACF